MQKVNEPPSNDAKKLAALSWQRDSEVRYAHASFNGELERVVIGVAVDWWRLEMESISDMQAETIDSHYANLKGLIRSGVVDKSWDVNLFNLSHARVLQSLKEKTQWSEEKRRIQLNSLLVFTSFLHAKSAHAFRLLQAPPELCLQSQIREVAPKVLTIEQWIKFRIELENLSLRDSLVAKMMSYTARSLAEILKLKVEALDFTTNVRVTFPGDSGEKIIIQLDSSVADQLRKYIDQSQAYRESSNPLIFLTKKGKPVFRTHFTKIFEKASANADLGFKVTASMIQWSQVVDRLHRMKLSRQEIMKGMKLKYIPRNLEI